jgi:hypothetical protein
MKTFCIAFSFNMQIPLFDYGHFQIISVQLRATGRYAPVRRERRINSRRRLPAPAVQVVVRPSSGTPCFRFTLSKTQQQVIHLFLGLPDPLVFGPPGSFSQRYGSGSFYHEAKIITYFVGTLKMDYENNRIRIRIRTKMSWIRNTASKIMKLKLWNLCLR